MLLRIVATFFTIDAGVQMNAEIVETSNDNIGDELNELQNYS